MWALQDILREYDLCFDLIGYEICISWQPAITAVLLGGFQRGQLLISVALLPRKPEQCKSCWCSQIDFDKSAGAGCWWGGGDGMWGAGVSCYEEEVSTWVKKEAKMRVWWWMMEGGRGKRSSWRKYLVEKMWRGGSGGVNSVIVWICECMYVFYGGRAMCNGVAEMISESGCMWVKWAGKRYRW